MSRISKSEGLSLFTSASLEELQARACEIRHEKHPNPTVTFVLDTNPNYTNICTTDCSFCAFRRNKEDPDAYHKSIEQVMEDIGRAHRAGLTTVLLQGGLHPGVTIDYLSSLVQKTKELYPSIHPHFFPHQKFTMPLRYRESPFAKLFKNSTLQDKEPSLAVALKSSPLLSMHASHRKSSPLRDGLTFTRWLMRWAFGQQPP